MKYEQVWNAIDKLAQINGMSPSGLAKKAGLDSTTFNKSKRIRPDGKKRWPSLDSINKILEVCNTSFEEFYNIGKTEIDADIQSSIPYIKFSKLSTTENLIDTSGWGKIRFPDTADNLYAVDIDVVDFEPFYRKNSVVIISKNSDIRRSDRVIIVKNNGEILLSQFIKRTAKTVEISDVLDGDNEKNINISDIKIINRIVWASQ